MDFSIIGGGYKQTCFALVNSEGQGKKLTGLFNLILFLKTCFAVADAAFHAVGSVFDVAVAVVAACC